MEPDEKKQWLISEYTLLSDHYFHEDNYYLKTNTLFITLNAALLGLISGQFGNGSKALTVDTIIIFAIIGLVSTFSWILTLLRTHVCRNMIEDRISEIETNVESIHKIRAGRPTPPFYAKIPSSIIMLVLPIVFSVVWIYHIVSV